MKILILGKGYIGNYLVAANKEHDVIHIGKSDLDYSDVNTFRTFLHRSTIYPKPKIDWIINCSGYTGRPNVEGCETDKENCYHYNVTVPLYLTRIANQMHIPIIHIGSGCIYDGYGREYNEDDFPNFGADSQFSSFYSKTKDAFERLSQHMERYVFRIRIPFNGIPEPKNYLWKLLNYNNLISQENSITNVDDLVNFVYKFIKIKKPSNAPHSSCITNGIYNVTNKGSVDAKTVTEMLKENGLENRNWKFVSIADVNFKVGRSNCILNTSKIEKLGLGLPSIKDSLERAIKQYADESSK